MDVQHRLCGIFIIVNEQLRLRYALIQVVTEMDGESFLTARNETEVYSFVEELGEGKRTHVHPPSVGKTPQSVQQSVGGFVRVIHSVLDFLPFVPQTPPGSH